MRLSPIETVEGGVAQFSSTVEFLTDNTFTESGTITFSQGNSLRWRLKKAQRRLSKRFRKRKKQSKNY